MKYFDIKKIEKSQEEIAELREALREELKTNQSYYVKLTGISKQHICSFIHNKTTFSIAKMIHIYKAIEASQK